MNLLKILLIFLLLSLGESKGRCSTMELIGLDNFVNGSSNERNDNYILLKVEELPGSVRKIYREWDSLSNLSKKKLFNKIFEKEKYWGYFFSSWGRYAFYTENSKVLRIFSEALRFVEQEYKVDQVILTSREVKEGHWYRETFARNMRLLLDAYTFTNESFVLDIIDKQTTIWMERNKKVNVSDFNIYPYSAKLFNKRSSEINPNQNLQMGLVLSKLYLDRNSKFYLNEEVKASALDEINAALSLVKDDGFFPLNQYAIGVGDSNYAGLSTIILYQLVQIWGYQEWLSTLKKVGLWLEKSFDEDRPWNTKKDGEDYHFDQFTAFNLFGRIPSFYAAGISSDRAKEWMEFIVSKFEDFNIIDLKPRWDELQTIPESYYSNELRSSDIKVLPPKIYVRKEKEIIYINFVATEIKSIIIKDVELDKIEDFVLENFTLNTGDEISVLDGQDNLVTNKISIPFTGNNLKIIVTVFDNNNPIKDK
ncbi:hypothetical protein FKX85_20305 [Echinicola soli]|uniref:Uncharacterized protein n=1 Tax=Echinicola soli TaxID=2591634 RepID=A0A514CN48_9BACT|nr:hypothetical protein [Echinicola soli]QDH81245.1 hypothetical protein FKX85_20305 [Echinicola soli]